MVILLEGEGVRGGGTRRGYAEGYAEGVRGGGMRRGYVEGVRGGGTRRILIG